ncbi:MAG TPA: hypothetical protein VNL98_07075 [Gemmatimonadales bacterium]|nr:hypothetical protein [Gemmatimonadales bacterium]
MRPEERALVADHGDREYVRFATGGWSGNEAIIAALQRNLMVMAMCWRVSTRGGLHIYALPIGESRP